MGKKRGKNRVGTGSETGFKRQKNGISPNSTIWNGEERPFFAVPHLSCRFGAVPPRFSPVFHDFRQKREKNGCPKMEERERKERVPFPFLSRSRFFPFLAWHISREKQRLPLAAENAAIEASNASLEVLIASLLPACGTTKEATFPTAINLLIAVGSLFSCPDGEWATPPSCTSIGAYNTLL